MSIKKLLLGLIVLSIFISCRHTPTIDCYGEYVNRIVGFALEGNFFENPELYNEDSIKIYYTSYDGCIVYKYNSTVALLEPENHLRYKGFNIMEINGQKMMGLDLHDAAYHKHGNSDFINPIMMESIIYIEWNSHDMDTVVATFVMIGSTIENSLPNGYCTFDVYDKVYYNGKLIVSSWEDNQEKMLQGIYPVIIKE